MAKHPQVPFITREGLETVVDEGIFAILTELKRLDVETLYSCQGELSPASNDRAYVSSTAKSFGPVLEYLVLEYDVTDLHTLHIEFVHHEKEGQEPRVILRWPAQKTPYFYELFKDMGVL